MDNISPLLGNDNSTNNASLPPDILMTPYIEIPYLLIVIIVGTIGNIFIIGATLIEGKLRNVGGVFIINLAIADLMITTWYLPAVLANVFNGYQNVFAGAKGLCDLNGFLSAWCCIVSMLTLTFIAFNRYWTVTRMNLHSKCFRKTLMVIYIIAIWIEGFLICLPLIVGWRAKPGDPIPRLIRFDEKMMACMWHDEAAPPFNIFLIVVAVFIPMMLTAYFYTSLFLFLKNRRDSLSQKRKQATMKQIPSLARINDSVTITEASSCGETSSPKMTPRNVQGKRVRPKSSIYTAKVTSVRRADDRERNLMLTLVVVVVFFAACWLPYGVISLSVSQTSALTKRACGWLALSNSAINSIIYGVLNRHFRRGYLKLLNKILSIFQCCSNERVKNILPKFKVRRDTFSAKSEENQVKGKS